jgi:tRNA threonylcarbamoyladenosine biosynthesis protein TsaB
VNILAIDTATSILSAALNTEAGIWYVEADAGHRHSEILMDLIETLIKTAGLKPENLEGLVCMKGPGSFTGLRIGFSAAKGLSLSLGIPLVSVPTLDCMALSVSAWPGLVLPLIDAKQRRFFTALYCGGRRLSDFADAGVSRILDMVSGAAAESPAGKKQTLLTGPDAGMFYAALNTALSEGAPPPPEQPVCLDSECRKGWAKEMLKVVKNIDIFNNRLDDVYSGPEYIRKSDAEIHLLSQGSP